MHAQGRGEGPENGNHVGFAATGETAGMRSGTAEASGTWLLWALWAEWGVLPIQGVGWRPVRLSRERPARVRVGCALP